MERNRREVKKDMGRAFEADRGISWRTSPIVFFTTGEFISSHEVLTSLAQRMVQRNQEGLETRMNTSYLAEQASVGFAL
jgi:hypothetical protein